MADNGRISSEMNKEFNKTLDFMSSLIQTSLKEIKETEGNLHILKNEIKHLSKNFDELSEIIKQNQKDIHNINLKLQNLENTSLMHKRELDDLNNHQEKEVEVQRISLAAETSQKVAVKTANATGKWQMRATMITAFLAFLAAVITSIFSYLKK